MIIHRYEEFDSQFVLDLKALKKMQKILEDFSKPSDRKLSPRIYVNTSDGCYSSPKDLESVLAYDNTEGSHIVSLKFQLWESEKNKDPVGLIEFNSIGSPAVRYQLSEEAGKEFVPILKNIFHENRISSYLGRTSDLLGSLLLVAVLVFVSVNFTQRISSQISEASNDLILLIKAIFGAVLVVNPITILGVLGLLYLLKARPLRSLWLRMVPSTFCIGEMDEVYRRRKRRRNFLFSLFGGAMLSVLLSLILDIVRGG